MASGLSVQVGASPNFLFRSDKEYLSNILFVTFATFVRDYSSR